MLLLLFNVGEEVCALDAASVVEVLPLVDIRKLRGAPKGVAGTFNYRGTFVPVIDLNDLTHDTPVQGRLSTRIILAHYTAAGERRLVGLIVENATETLRCAPTDFVLPGVVTEAAPYLGPIIIKPEGGQMGALHGSIQRIEVDKLVGAVIPDFLLSA